MPTYGRTFAMIALPPISSKLCQPLYSFAPTSGMLLSHARSGTVISPLVIPRITGPLVSTRLLTSSAIGIIKTKNSSNVITSTASVRRPNNNFCKRNSSGQVATTTVPAHANPRMNGRTIHRHAMIMMAKNSTDSSICATSLG
ncbi:hypothetical protein D3C72_1989680 [compost metagenome]